MRSASQPQPLTRAHSHGRDVQAVGWLKAPRFNARNRSTKTPGSSAGFNWEHAPLRQGSLAHSAATVWRRRPTTFRMLTGVLVLLVVAVGTQRAMLKEPCEEIPRDTPVAVLMAGPARSLNRTHCSFTKHIIAPLIERGHKVVVFVSTDRDEGVGGGGGYDGKVWTRESGAVGRCRLTSG